MEFDNDYEVTRWVERFDEIAKSYEAIWGIGMLQKIVSPETQKKWNSQIQKFDNAVAQKHAPNLRQIVEGCERGWAAMEKEARAAGHSSNENYYWEIAHPDSKNVYRIYKTTTAAHAPSPDGVRKYSLEEVVRVLESKSFDAVNQVKELLPGATVTEVKKMDFNTGDEIPF